jgi:two-component system, NtrC family, response regulator AtoC
MIQVQSPPHSVVIVEDDQVTADTFSQILTHAGYDVTTAPDEEAGLQAIQRIDPSAVLLDLHLKSVDAIGLLRRLRASQSRADVPVAIVTGDYFIDETVARDLEEMGAHVFFKPLWEEDLLPLVRGLVARHRPVR